MLKTSSQAANTLPELFTAWLVTLLQAARVGDLLAVPEDPHRALRVSAGPAGDEDGDRQRAAFGPDPGHEHLGDELAFLAEGLFLVAPVLEGFR